MMSVVFKKLDCCEDREIPVGEVVILQQDDSERYFMCPEHHGERIFQESERGQESAMADWIFDMLFNQPRKGYPRWGG